MSTFNSNYTGAQIDGAVGAILGARKKYLHTVSLYPYSTVNNWAKGRAGKINFSIVTESADLTYSDLVDYFKSKHLTDNATETATNLIPVCPASGIFVNPNDTSRMLIVTGVYLCNMINIGADVYHWYLQGKYTPDTSYTGFAENVSINSFDFAIVSTSLDLGKTI